MSAVDCEAKAVNLLKDEMNTGYAAVLAKAKARDQSAKEEKLPALYQDNEKKLITSQSAFDTYIEAECDRQAYFAAGGTGAADLQMKCEFYILKSRMEALKTIE